MRYARRVLAALVLVVAVACLSACAARHPGAPPSCGRDPADILACVRRQEDAVASLRAVFTAETNRRSQRNSASGVLLVAKPDAFRLRLMLPLGLTMFDYTKLGEQVRISLPLEGRVLTSGEVAAGVPFSEADLAQAFLRGPFAFPGTCEPTRDGPESVLVHCRDQSGTLLRQLRLDAKRATIIEETSYDGEQPRLLLRYDDYRAGDDAFLPYRISLSVPAQQVSLNITVDRYEVNAALSPSLFQLVDQ